MNTQNRPDSEISEALELGTSNNRGKSYRRRSTIVMAIAIIGVVVFISWTKMNGSETVRYETHEVTRGDLTVIVTATGTLQPTNEVEVSSELSGIVKHVQVDFNDRVKTGQILARLDTTKLDAQVTQAKAALESAGAKVLQAQATLTEATIKLDQLKKLRQLSGNQMPAQTDMDAAHAAVERAKANKASANAEKSQAEATLKAIETDLAKSVICSPIDGVVLSRNVEPGQTVAASFTAPVLFTLAEDLTQMELHVNVDEADIGKVTEGQNAVFTVAAYSDRTFHAIIVQTRYGSSTTSGVVTYETVLKVDNSDLSLRPGMTATANITAKKIENAILIPTAALRFSPPVQSQKSESSGGLVGSLLPHPPRESGQKQIETKQQLVWTLKDGKPVEISVTTGMTDGKMSELVNGNLEIGMALITDFTTSES